ncbi:MAG: Pvc16 family protein [Oscillochloridaceae bacterium umkhey_bin13]
MAGFFAVQAVSEAIRALLHDRRPRELPELATLNVRLAQPTDFEAGKINGLATGIAVVLYRVAPSLARRALPPRQLADGRRLAHPLSLQLHYLMIAYGLTAAQQQLVLGWCALTLHTQLIILPTVLNRQEVYAGHPLVLVTAGAPQLFISG